jgi:hypothetical protein
MRSVRRECEGCHKHLDRDVEFESQMRCPFCFKTWAIGDEKSIFEKCPFCQCRQFYIQKDFNRTLGCAIMLIGIILVPVTYGLSLAVFSLLDWVLYKKVKEIAICYRCGTEFRGFAIPAHFKPFLHHIGAKYDK